MKRLILMRHAKSSWASAGLEDHERLLNERGRRSATALGDWMRAKAFIPDQSLVSSSERTRETFDRLKLAGNVQFLEALYLADPDRMSEVLRSATGAVVLMIGHNPGIAYFAERLVSSPPDHTRFGEYPTGATLVADFPIDDWRDVAPGTGQPLDFIVPRELTD